MKKQFFILASLLIISINSFCQAVTTDWHFNETLNYCYVYDRDLKKATTGLISGNYPVIVDIDSNGTGRFVFYTDDLHRKKIILSIDDAFWFISDDKKSKCLRIDCRNPNEVKSFNIIAFDMINEHRMDLSAIWIYNDNDNTAIVFTTKP